MITLILTNNKYNSNFRLFKRIKINELIKRTLLSRLQLTRNSLKTIVETPKILSLIQINYREKTYATQVACKVDPTLANDGTGKHTHIAKQSCILLNCENIECPHLCAAPNVFRITGHNTHKPPVGRMTRFISETDANGNPKAQYFVKTNEKKEITDKEKQEYGNKIKPYIKHQDFIDENASKYHD